MTMPTGVSAELAGRVVRLLIDSGTTVAAAESLTGGLLTAALTSVPGSSAVVRGGVVAYATVVKAGLLGVDAELLDRVGPVDPVVAEQMAVGAARALGAQVGVATTGEAGPDSGSGAPVGTVFVAVAGAGGVRGVGARLVGGRDEVRAGTVRMALELLREVLTPG